MRKGYIFIILLVICAFAFGFGLRQNSPADIQNNRHESVSDITASGNKNENKDEDENKDDSGGNGIRFIRNIQAEDFKDIQYTPWDVQAASAQISVQDKKAYTIMVYMNGSDLESENGAATDDIIEMLDSGVNTDDVNVILFTGGTNRWQNDVIPENNCMIWKITDGEIEELAGVGLVNMGDSGTLSSFIDFSLKNFPADKYGLILWDHGGGSIAGYGHDEKFNNSNLMLLDMNYAFKISGLSKNKLEFLGFDSCLMATVEMAVVASEYARYLVASEDLEPGAGWDYSFLSVLNSDPSMNGAAIGMAITDYFMGYYGKNSDEFLTLSVVDLSTVDEVMGAVGNLMSKCSLNLLEDRASSFAAFAKKRHGTKTFGEGSPRDNECDMVDIGDMARRLSDLFPEEAARVLSALEKSVVYNRHNSDTDLKGLSTYYIYGGKDTAKESLPTYASLKMNGDYTEYLYDFADMLNLNGRAKRKTRSRSSGQEGDNNMPSKEELVGVDLTVWQPAGGSGSGGSVDKGKFIMTGIKNGADIDPYDSWTVNRDVLWPQIGGKYVCLYEINSDNGHSLYAIPAELNGKECDIMVLFGERNPDGKILGARQEDGFVIQKGFDKIEDGDKVLFYYQERNFGVDEDSGSDSGNWYKGDEFTVKEELKLEWAKRTDDEAFCSLRLTDVWRNVYFTGLTRIQ